MPGRSSSVGPEDLPENASWSDYSDQQDIMVSYRYARRADFPSLMEFFLDRVRRSFTRGEKKDIKNDVRNYVDRVCVMRDLSRPELIQFISDHSGPTLTVRVPKVPDHLKSAVICRDEPSTKEVIWETGNGYWAMVWTRGRSFGR